MSQPAAGGSGISSRASTAPRFSRSAATSAPGARCVWSRGSPGAPTGDGLPRPAAATRTSRMRATKSSRTRWSCGMRRPAGWCTPCAIIGTWSTRSPSPRKGGLIAASSRDGKIRLHEVASGRLIKTLSRAVGNTRMVMVPDGRRLAVDADDRSVVLWDFTTGARSVLLPAPSEGVYSPCVFSADGRWLATLGRGVQLWDAATGTQVAWPDRAERECMNLAISPDSRYLAAGSLTGNVTVRNLADGRLWRTLAGHEGKVHEVVFSPDSHYLATVGQDRTAGLGRRTRILAPGDPRPYRGGQLGGFQSGRRSAGHRRLGRRDCAGLGPELRPRDRRQRNRTVRAPSGDRGDRIHSRRTRA